MEYRIDTNNGGHVIVSLETNDYHHAVLRFTKEDGDRLVIPECEIVSLYNLVKQSYMNSVCIEELLVYSNIYEEIERLGKKYNE